MMRLKRLLIGRPLKSEEAQGQHLSKTSALAIFSSSALSSVSYGPEQIALALAVPGLIAYGYFLYALIPILALLAAVTISYTQVAKANPGGGGAYSVAKENLGELPALAAGAALFSDYTLTVAVSITSGTEALTSAFPALIPHRLLIDLAVLIGVLMLINLRGVSESAKAFVFPTYLFVGGILGVIGLGLYQTWAGTAPVIPAVSEEKQGMNWLIFFLILRAFANGCSSMTGIEAIANGVPTFKKPQSRNAVITTYWMSGLLAVMLCGISFLILHHHILPVPGVTMMSQLTEETVGRGALYYYIQMVTMLILFLAANTAYNGLPPLMSLMARDGYLPRYLGERGERLSYSNGILLLTAASALLLIVFDGDMESLIALYSVGVFISFTIAQCGMVVHWRRQQGENWKWRLAVNAFGALITGVVVIILTVTKFLDGAWIVLLFVPLMVMGFRKIRVHYVEMGKELVLSADEPLSYMDHPIRKNCVIVPISYPTRSAVKALRYARKIGDQIIAVHIAENEETARAVAAVWSGRDPELELVTLYSPYRLVIQPLLDFVQKTADKQAPDDCVTVLIPEVRTERWWHRLLHNQTGLVLRTLLIRRENVVVTTITFRVHH